jgi:hypothetical protein
VTSTPSWNCSFGLSRRGLIGIVGARASIARGGWLHTQRVHCDWPDVSEALKAFAGSMPITRASGRKTVVTHRHIKNRRLSAVGQIWALGSLRASPGAADTSPLAEPPETGNDKRTRVFNKFLGQLHHYLQTGQPYNENRAFPPPLQRAA